MLSMVLVVMSIIIKTMMAWPLRYCMGIFSDLFTVAVCQKKSVVSVEMVLSNQSSERSVMKEVFVMT